MKLFLIGAAILLWQVETSPANDASLEVVRAGYLQRLASIQSVKASYEFRGVNLETLQLSEPSEFVDWMSQEDDWRYRRNLEDMGKPILDEFRGPVDTAVKDGVSTTVRPGFHGPTERAQATIAHSSPGTISFSDFRSRCLDFVQDSPPLTVSDVLDDTSNVRSCERLDAGRYSLQYDVEPGCTAQIWFDSKKNFMVDRIDITYTENPRFAGISQEVVEVVEAQPGIWFPREVDLKQFRRDESSGKTIEPKFANRMIVTELAVNESLPEDAFEVTLPPGTEVSNEITGKLVFWGVDGPASEEMPLPNLQTPPEMSLTEKDGRSSRSVWVITVNLVLVAIVALIVLVRRRM